MYDVVELQLILTLNDPNSPVGCHVRELLSFVFAGPAYGERLYLAATWNPKMQGFARLADEPVAGHGDRA